MDILEFKDKRTVPDVVLAYTPALKNNAVPIIIDNGSYQARVGWATMNEPQLTFRNLIAKPRKERSKKDTVEVPQQPQLQVGNEIVNIEAVRFQLKTQFDRNVVTHFEAQEHLLDYTFKYLGINSDSVPHPIVITEAYLNPNSSRHLMSELLFECYGVPSVSYGVDSLFAYHYSQPNPQENALIVSLGYHTMHIIPVINNKTIFENTRRINMGGFHVVTFLHRILQLKYPAHTNAITLSRIEELLHTICLVAENYTEELSKWTDPDYYEKNTKRIQLPFNTTITSSTLTTEQQKERKRELARRLTEINARKREVRLAEDEEKLQRLLEIQESLDITDPEEVDAALSEFNLKNTDDLNKNITMLNTRIERTKQKIIAANNAEEIIVDEPPAKQSKITKMVFENEKAMHLYIQNAKKLRQEILNKKATRKQRKQDMAKRRTAAGQERMRIISQLARKEKGNDDFGLRDEDWEIYKTISRDGGDSDSEAENEKLLEVEEIIKTYEPLEEDESMTPGEMHQLHVGIERYRAPELLFKPYMMGSSEAGLSEVIAYVINLFQPDEQNKLASNIVIMGGLASLPGLQQRVYADLLSVRPFKSTLNIKIMPNTSLCGWYGARFWANRSEFKKSVITKKAYEEYGPEYLNTHLASNPYYPTPKEQLIDVDM